MIRAALNVENNGTKVYVINIQPVPNDPSSSFVDVQYKLPSANVTMNQTRVIQLMNEQAAQTQNHYGEKSLHIVSAYSLDDTDSEEKVAGDFSWTEIIASGAAVLVVLIIVGVMSYVVYRKRQKNMKLTSSIRFLESTELSIDGSQRSRDSVSYFRA